MQGNETNAKVVSRTLQLGLKVWGEGSAILAYYSESWYVSHRLSSLCSSRKYPYPPWGATEILRGGGSKRRQPPIMEF